MPQPAPMQTIFVGDASVTYIPDGMGAATATALFPASTAADWQGPYANKVDGDGRFITSIGAFIITIGDQIIAVDAGIGPVTVDFPGFGPFSGGSYLDNASGYIGLGAVTDVFFTHMHLDHVGWTTVDKDGARQLTYPNARHRTRQPEWELWHGGDNPAGPNPDTVQKPLEGKIGFVQDGDELAPGLRVVATPGHTPGHSSLILSSKGERLVLTADVLFGTMHFEKPEWAVAFDADPAEAQRSRERLFVEMVMPNTITAVNHFADQVFGRVSLVDGQYKWEPLHI